MSIRLRQMQRTAMLRSRQKKFRRSRIWGMSKMAATIIDGKALAAKKKAQVAEQTAKLRSRPGLAVILVGDDPASRVYVTSKRLDCEECGFYSEELWRYPQRLARRAPSGGRRTRSSERPEIDGISLPAPAAQGGMITIEQEECCCTDRPI